MTAPEPPTDTTPVSSEPKHMLAPLIQSLPVAYIVYFFLILGFVLSTLLFLYQVRGEVEPGVLLIDSRIGRLEVFGHLFRATAFLLLAWSLRKYLSSLRGIRRNEPNAFEKFVNASRSWWNAVFFSVLLILVYGGWALIVHLDPFCYLPGGIYILLQETPAMIMLADLKFCRVSHNQKFKWNFIWQKPALGRDCRNAPWNQSVDRSGCPPNQSCSMRTSWKPR